MSNSQTAIIDAAEELPAIDGNSPLSTLEDNTNEQLLDVQNIPAEQSVLSQGEAPISMANLQNVPVKICAVLGQKKIDVSSLLSLKKGEVIDIDKKVGDPIDLYVNGSLVAHGELVISDGCLAISMIEIVQSNNIV